MYLEHAPYSDIVAGNVLFSPSTLCRHIFFLFGERLDIFFHSGPVHRLSDSLRIYFFSTLESKFHYFFPDSLSNSPDSTGAVSGKKKLRIRKYLDTCERGLGVHALQCSKQILCRELSPIVCSTSVSSHGWKAFRGLDSQAFPGVSFKTLHRKHGDLKFRGNLSHVHQRRRPMFFNSLM